MFRSKTVFVVGAGASKEFGLPIGSELATQIGSHLKLEVDRFGNFLGGEYELYEACQRAANRDQKEVREYLRACKAISDALPTAVSIDTYLEVHEGDKEIEVCGKLGIVHSILRAERASHLRAQAEDDSAPPLFTNGPVLQSWLALFVKMVQVGITKHNVERALENVTFVIFNYDRCVEHYLFHWFQLFYRIDASVAAQILSRARFYHPYGVAGDLPWQSRSGDGVPFGANLGADRLLNVATRIRTYSEQVEDRATQDHIHNAIADASRLVLVLDLASRSS